LRQYKCCKNATMNQCYFLDKKFLHSTNLSISTEKIDAVLYSNGRKYRVHLNCVIK